MRLGQRLKTLEEAAGNARRVVVYCASYHSQDEREARRNQRAHREGIPPENVDLVIVHTGVPKGAAA